MSEQADKLILGAVDVLDRKGWCQHHLQSDEGRYCMMGAMYAAAESMNMQPDDPDREGEEVGYWNNEVFHQALDRVEAAIPVSAPSAADYNDASHRTYAEVRQVMMNAAKA